MKSQLSARRPSIRDDHSGISWVTQRWAIKVKRSLTPAPKRSTQEDQRPVGWSHCRPLKRAKSQSKLTSLQPLAIASAAR